MNTAIVITNYNYGKFVTTAIDSALNQTIKPDELVIVDDASTDDSVNIIEKHLKTVSDKYTTKIKLIVHNTNQGLPTSRNTGIQNTNSPIIGFLDADDIYYPAKMQASRETFEEFPEISCVYSDYDVIDLRNGQSRREFKFSYDVGLLLQTCIVSTNSVFHRNFFEKVGLYNPTVKVAEDYELYLRAYKTQLFWHIPKPLFLYRLHGKNITLTQVDQMMRNESEYKRRLLNVAH